MLQRHLVGSKLFRLDARKEWAQVPIGLCVVERVHVPTLADHGAPGDGTTQLEGPGARP